MKRTIRVLYDEAVLEVSYEGPITFQGRSESLDLITPLFRTYGLTGLLVDFSKGFVVEDEPGARGDFAAKLAMLPLQGCRVAFVNLPSAHGGPPAWVSAVAVYETRRFNCRDEALQWLTVDEATRAG